MYELIWILHGRMFKGLRGKKNSPLDLAWVGLSCRPAFKITSVPFLYKKHGLAFALYTYQRDGMREQQQPKCKLMGWLELTTTTDQGDWRLKREVKSCNVGFCCQSLDLWGQWGGHENDLQFQFKLWDKRTQNQHTKTKLKHTIAELLRIQRTKHIKVWRSEGTWHLCLCTFLGNGSLSRKTQHLSETSGTWHEETLKVDANVVTDIFM